MASHAISSSPQRYARACGALYLAVIVLGAFSEGYVTGKLIDPASSAVSAANILAAPGLWNTGVATDLLVVLLAVPQLWLEYLLLKTVDRNLALLAVMFNLISLAVEAVSKLFMFVMLPILSHGEYVSAFTPAQLHQLAYLAFRLHNIAFNLALLFFAFTCLLYGYLIVRSGFLPKAVGVLMAGAGLAYLLACTAALFFPTLSAALTPGIFLPVLLGEASFCLWLLVKGVNQEKWRERIARDSPVPA